jgi:hypothetical protein
MRRNKLFALFIVTNLLLVGAVTFLVGTELARARGQASLAAQTTPKLISYQGTLADDTGVPISGTKAMTIGVYSAATGGSPLWQENHNPVTLNNGAFSLMLGANSSLPDTLFDQPDRWLETAVDGVTLSPRQRFTSVPYALNADKVDGIDGSELGAFPSPAYDSGWVSMPITDPPPPFGISMVLTHSLGGDTNNYVVDMTAISELEGQPSNTNVGWGQALYWNYLNSETITIHNVNASRHLRIRIWVYK